MELKVKTPTFPEVIEFNFEELKQEIEERTKNYANLIYAEDQMKQAKTDVANLRKFTKALSDERIKIKKECMKPYEDFETKIKELDGIVSKAISNIDSQIKAAEEQKKKEKKEKIIELFKNAVFPDWVKFEQVFDTRWLNASVSMTTVSKELIARLEQIENDISTLSNLPEFGFEAVEVYKSTFDINRALNEGKRLSEIQKRKAEEERIAAERKAKEEAQKQQEEQLSGQIGFADAESFEKNGIVPTAEEKYFEECITPPVEEREWIGFKAYLTELDAQNLAAFFAARGIQYEAIEV